MKRLLLLIAFTLPLVAQQTQKPPLHAAHWIAITGKPLAATAGSMMFQKGGNAVDAACAMLAATSTMWDTLGWGGETQALIYDPRSGKVIGINALGVAPSGATAQFFRDQKLAYPPEYGPLAAVTPGTPGGLMVMLAEYGKLSLADVLGPAIQMAEGFPIEAQLANVIEREKERIREWPSSRALFLPNAATPVVDPAEQKSEKSGAVTPAHDVAAAQVTTAREGPEPGSMFRQPKLAATLRKLVEAERQAKQRGKSRKDAILAAYDRFYRGDIAREIARSTQDAGGLITEADLANWRVRIEEPVSTRYKDIDVYKLTVWTQGPSMLQALNILENFDLRDMGYNSTRYIHTLYQALNLAFADRDFYYGDPYFPPTEPVKGLLSKEYARERAKRIDMKRNDPNAMPGDPYPYQGETHPFLDLLESWKPGAAPPRTIEEVARFETSFALGTTSIQAADEEGWVVSVTPSGGWVPAFIAGETGIGLSQRAQSFDTDRAQNPYNVIEPGKRPHVTLTPTIALREGKPFLSFAVQGGDTQDQNLLQFFLNVVEFGMTPQEAAEAANFNSFQVRKWLGDRLSMPGRILLHEETPSWIRNDLRSMGYTLVFSSRTSGPINAIWFDREHGTMWGASSNHGEDHGVAW
jgi:gamma-glutamyltranspeptidase/glutathione hydrolase